MVPAQPVESHDRRVLLLDGDSTHAYQALFRERSPSLTFSLLSENRNQSYDQFDIWFGAPDKAAELLREGYKPRWLQLTWAGFSPLQAPSMPTGYLLSRAVGVFGQPMLEYVLFHILRHIRPSAAYTENQDRFIWCPVHSGGLQGLRVMLVGAGDIGLYIARHLSMLGVIVSGVQRSPEPDEFLTEVFDLQDFRSGFGEADVVINILPDSSETRNLFGYTLFCEMKPSALFINVGRGSAVVDGELVTALEEGRLAAAVLDVFRHEPLPPSHQFWITPNLIITPHIAGPVDPFKMVDLFLANLERFNSGSALLGQVDLALK